MNFSIHKNSDQVLFRYGLRGIETGEVMTNRIEYVFLEIPNCKKAFTPKASTLDNLCYVLGHIADMDNRPDGTDGELFDLLFKSAEIANFAPSEHNEYIKDMTTERDRVNQLNFAEKKGLEQGMEQGQKKASKEIAKKLLETGMAVKEVSRITELSVEEVESLG